MPAIKATCTSEPVPAVCEPCKEQYLFLLEFYVRCVKSPRLAKLNQMFYVPTTVAFHFLDFQTDDDLQITPVDTQFEPAAGIADDVEPFYAGRSVLFALAESAVTDIQSPFKINICVFKQMPEDIKPDVLIGKAHVDMTMHFAALRKELLDGIKYPESAIPDPAKVFDDDVTLCFDGCPCGSLGIYARISAYGQTLITEFSIPNDNIASAASFLFQAFDAQCDNRPLSYKCRVLDPDVCSITSLQSENKRKKCLVCKPPKLTCLPCQIESGGKIVEERGMPKEVCKKKKKSEPQCVPNPPCPPPKDPCSNPTPCCPPGIQTSRGPKEPCGKAVVLKVSGLLDCDAEEPENPTVTVTPESEAIKPAEINADPDHDVFILRIGKKGIVGEGEKSDIQLEMRTPKGKERGPPVRLETREMQTEDGKAKKGGKGKKK